MEKRVSLSDTMENHVYIGLEPPEEDIAQYQSKPSFNQSETDIMKEHLDFQEMICVDKCSACFIVKCNINGTLQTRMATVGVASDADSQSLLNSWIESWELIEQIQEEGYHRHIVLPVPKRSRETTVQIRCDSNLNTVNCKHALTISKDIPLFTLEDVALARFDLKDTMKWSSWREGELLYLLDILVSALIWADNKGFWAPNLTMSSLRFYPANDKGCTIKIGSVFTPKDLKFVESHDEFPDYYQILTGSVYVQENNNAPLKYAIASKLVMFQLAKIFVILTSWGKYPDFDILQKELVMKHLLSLKPRYPILTMFLEYMLNYSVTEIQSIHTIRAVLDKINVRSTWQNDMQTFLKLLLINQDKIITHQKGRHERSDNSPLFRISTPLQLGNNDCLWILKEYFIANYNFPFRDNKVEYSKNLNLAYQLLEKRFLTEPSLNHEHKKVFSRVFRELGFHFFQNSEEDWEKSFRCLDIAFQLQPIVERQDSEDLVAHEALSTLCLKMGHYRLAIDKWKALDHIKHKKDKESTLNLLFQLSLAQFLGDQIQACLLTLQPGLPARCKEKKPVSKSDSERKNGKSISIESTKPLHSFTNIELNFVFLAIKCHIILGDYKSAKRLLEETQSQSETLIPKYKAKQAKVSAKYEEKLGNYEQALLFYKKASSLLIEGNARNTIKHIETLQDLIFLLLDVGQLEEATNRFSDWRQIKQNVVKSTGLTIYDGYQLFFQSQIAYGKNEPFRHLLDEALSVFARFIGENSLLYCRCKSKIALALAKENKLNDAILVQFQILESLKKLIGDDNVDYGNAMTALGHIYLAAEEWDKASHYLAMSLRIKEKILPEVSQQLVVLCNDIATAAYHLNEYNKAIEYTKKAISLLRRSFSSDPSELAVYNYNLAMLYYLHQELEQAHKVLVEVYENLEGFHINPPSKLCLNIWKSLSVILKKVGKINESQKYQDKYKSGVLKLAPGTPTANNHLEIDSSIVLRMDLEEKNS